MDVVAYSRLMGVDEIGTLTALKAHRSQFIDPLVSAHSGRLVKTTGDGLLLEFASVVDAIACAVSIQRGMLSRNAEVPEDRRIVFRIEVNIGDVIIDGSDLFGDGVNVAARLEALCEPGGICISRSANEQVRDKLSLSFADLGEHTVKNIARAVGVFGLTALDIAKLPESRLIGRSHHYGATTRHLPRKTVIAAGGVLDRLCRHRRLVGDLGADASRDAAPRSATRSRLLARVFRQLQRSIVKILRSPLGNSSCIGRSLLRGEPGGTGGPVTGPHERLPRRRH